MNNLPIRQNSPFTSTRPLRHKLVAIALVGTMFGTVAHGQVFVTDKLSITANEKASASQLAKTVQQYAKQLDEYRTQLQQYTTQISQYQQILTSIQTLATGGITLSSGKLDKITDASSFVQQSCPGGAGGGIIGSMASIVTSSFNKSITRNQQDICVHIVLLQIDKYNKTVDIVNDTQEFGKQLTQIESSLKQVTTQGDSGKLDANASVQATQIATAMTNWQTQMKSDDAMISALEQQQGILAKIALNGSNTILGNVVQAAAFAKAFD